MPRTQRLRATISLLTGGYTLALLIFLVLRLIFADSFWWLALLANFTPFYFAPFAVLLPLALIARAKRSVLLMLPFALIGIVWFGRLYLPKTATQAPDDATMLRVVTFNVWGDNPNMSDVENWLREMRADIVIIQEVPPTWADMEVEAFEDIYPYQANQPVAIRYWGNNTWSRYPITAIENFDLEGDGTPTHSRIVIDVGERQIAVYNIHLMLPMGETLQIHLPFNNPFWNMAAKYDHTIRNEQIVRLIERLKGEPLPYIVAGDFNMSDQTMVYNDLAAFMTDSFREAGQGLGASWPNVQRMGLPSLIPPLVRIDYIWHSVDFRTLDAALGPYLGSDHLPVYATLALG